MYFKSILLFSLIFLLLIISACKKENQALETSDYLIFGHFYGECLGEECVETFMLTEDHLYEDINDNYAGGPFDFKKLGDNKFDLVNDLVDKLPAQLLSQPDTTFGCPDCADGGGLFIQYAIDSNIQTWKIDQFENNIPQYLHSFVDEVNLKIEQIND